MKQILVLCSSLSLPVFLTPTSPPQQPSPPQTGTGQSGAELGIEGLEAPQCPVSVGSLGLGSVLAYAGIFSRMLGTLGLWTLLPAAAQGKCLQRGEGSLYHSVREKVYLKQQSPISKRPVGWMNAEERQSRMHVPMAGLRPPASADPVSCASIVLTWDLDIMFCLSLAAICPCLHSLLDSPFLTLDFSIPKQEDLCVL